MASPSSIITLGLGAAGTASLIITLGMGIGAPPAAAAERSIIVAPEQRTLIVPSEAYSGETAIVSIQHSGTAQAGAASSITLASSASEVADAYKYMKVRILSGTGAGQERNVVGSRKNWQIWSNDFTKATWGITQPLTSGQSDMVGGNAAGLITGASPGNAYTRAHTIGPQIGSKWRYCIDLKSESGTQYFYVQLKGGDGGAGIAGSHFLLTTAWQRVYVETPALTQVDIIMLLRPSNGTNVVTEQRTFLLGRPNLIDVTNGAPATEEYIHTEASAAVGAAVDTPWATQPDATSAYTVTSVQGAGRLIRLAANPRSLIVTSGSLT